MRAEREEFKRPLNITTIFQMSLKDKKTLGQKLEFLASIPAFRVEFISPVIIPHDICLSRALHVSFFFNPSLI